MNSACEKTKPMTTELFEHGISNKLKSLYKDSKNVIELCHGSKIEITKQFNPTTSTKLPNGQEDKFGS